MKFAKLSLAAIMAMGIAGVANATDIKVDGSVKVYYGTNDMDDAAGNSQDLFDQGTSYGDAAIRVGMTAENMPGGLTGRLSTTYLTTMGLEGRLVSGVWAGANSKKLPVNVSSKNNPNEKFNADVETGSLDGIWFDEANLKGTVFDKTTIIAGRQYLDTPMVFSEKWNIVSNSYDAAVVVDQHIEKTALVAAWVWRSNINGAYTVSNGDGSFNDGFQTFGTVAGVHKGNGAYAFGAVTSLIPYTTAQAWYYSVDSVADAFWLQADMKPSFGDGVNLEIGGQFAGTMATDNVSKLLAHTDTYGYALKAGVDFAGARVSAAYSSTDIGDIGLSNVGGSQSKLYTEAWWNYGYVSRPDTDAYNITAEYTWADVADFGAYYTHSESNGNNNNGNSKFLNGGAIIDQKGKEVDMDEFTLTASKNFGAFDTAVAYIYTNADDQNNGDSYNTVQLYLTYNF